MQAISAWQSHGFCGQIRSRFLQIIQILYDYSVFERPQQIKGGNAAPSACFRKFTSPIDKVGKTCYNMLTASTLLPA